jgi:alpha-N-arabinofuranosidase
MIARSATPFGPFEPCPANPIVTHRDRPRHPIQAVGHADLVELADGTWWAVMLGIRPRRGRHHHLGRETFLAPVRWTTDGWPIFGDGGRIELEMPAPRLAGSAPPEQPPRDDFDGEPLAPTWCFVRNPVARDVSLSARRGFLRLTGSRVSLDAVDSPSAVFRRQSHFDVTMRALLEFSPARPNEEAGVTIRGNEDFRYDVAVRLGDDGREAVLRRRLGGVARIVSRQALGPGPVEIRVDATGSDYAFAAGAPGKPRALGSLPTRALSAESIAASKRIFFTGAFVGLYATGNGRRSSVPADFDWFDYRPRGS